MDQQQQQQLQKQKGRERKGKGEIENDGGVALVVVVQLCFCAGLVVIARRRRTVRFSCDSLQGRSLSTTKLISCYNNSVVSSVISYCCSSVTLCKHIVQSATLLRFDPSSVCTSAKEVKCFLIGQLVGLSVSRTVLLKILLMNF